MRVTATTLFVISSLIAKSQDFPRSTVDPSHLTDDLAAFQDSDINYEELLENYVQLYSNPINLNIATKHDLLTLQILSDNQIENFLAHIEQHGQLISVYELQSVKGFNLDIIYKLIPFVIVEDPKQQFNSSLLKRIVNNGNSYFVSRYGRTLQKSKGYQNTENEDGRFQGSPDKLYMRFRRLHNRKRCG
jgi:hypothetical protein